MRRFQQFDTAQLILEAASKGSSQASSSSHPQEIENQNEVLLPEPSYTGPVQVIMTIQSQHSVLFLHADT